MTYKYEKVIREIENKILNGDYQKDSPIDSIGEIKRKLNINYNTALKGFDKLKQRNIIYKENNKFYITKEAKKLIKEKRRKKIKDKLEEVIEEADKIDLNLNNYFKKLS